MIMANRFTDTNKWHDAWFASLKPLEKLLFNYLCDNCDIAGFIEVIVKNWASDIGCNISQIEGALKGLERGLIFSKTNDCVYLRNFLKHQKNLPLNELNQCHKGIFKRFELYKSKFEIDSIIDFIQGAKEGLRRGYGNGNSIGNDNSLSKKETIINIDTWKTNFEIYFKEITEAYESLKIDQEYIRERETYHPGLDVPKSLEKAFKDYWVTEVAWRERKRKRTLENDWRRTFNNALTMKCNQVWKPKEQLNKGENPPGFKYPSISKPALRTLNN